MKALHKVGYATLASALMVNQSFAAITFDNNKIQSGLQGDSQTADVTIQTLITRAMVFLALIAVCYGLYGGFLMLTAGGNEGRVKTGRTILLQVAIGLVVIFLANSLVQFVLQALFVPQ